MIILVPQSLSYIPEKGEEGGRWRKGKLTITSLDFVCRKGDMLTSAQLQMAPTGY